MQTTNPSRRTFLKASALVAGGLVIAFVVPQTKRFFNPASNNNDASTFTPNAFLSIAPDNTVTILLAHSEMGQGIWTTLPMLIAEELDADWDTIKVQHAPPAAVYAHTAYGMQITGGSTTTWSEFDRYRQAGATARALLLAAAAQQLNTPLNTLKTENGHVIYRDQSIPYGDLATLAATLPVPKTVSLKKSQDWQLIGKATKRLDRHDKTNGRAQFGQDIQFDGLMTAVVLRAPTFGGSLKSYDDSAALKVPGVRKVVQVPTGLAVIADHYWAAKKGRDALKADWNAGPGTPLDTEQLLTDFRQQAEKAGAVAAKAGNVQSGLKAANQTITAEYYAPYLAHAPMEPLNCTVKIDGDGCEIWTGTQVPGLEQAVAAKILNIDPAKVKVNIPFLGGAFGRRGNPANDFVAEATEVAKAAGMPVKTVWSREDDVKGGYYRPMFLHKVTIGLGSTGKPTSWQHTCVGQSIMTGTPFASAMIKDGVDAVSVEGVADSPYIKDVANHLVDLHTPQLAIPVLWWRSVGHSHSGFVMESLIDELAHAAGQDPYRYRQALLKDHPRHLAALNLAAEKAGWTAPPPSGQSRGIAVHESFGSFVAHVAEVSVADGKVKVHRVVCAIDCGLAVNPDALKAQMESCIAFGLGTALSSQITFKDGQVAQSNFYDYQVLRINEMPKVEVYIVPSTDKMGGAGEPGLPPIAPAVTNAIFAATGKRIRHLPIADQLA